MDIRLNNVSAGYGRGSTYVPVLRDIDLTIPEGSRIAILGANGSGKTTLLRTMTGMLPYEGQVFLGSNELKNMKHREIASCLAMMMQVSETYFSYTVRETVLLGRYVRIKPGRAASQEDRSKVEECLRITGLTDQADHPIGALSGGQLQRVFLARTLAQETPVILLDEPTNHLDLKVQSDMMEYLDNWSRELGHTLIGVYHDVNLALAMADTLVVLKDGQIIACGSYDEIRAEGALDAAYDMDIASYMKKQYERWK